MTNASDSSPAPASRAPAGVLGNAGLEPGQQRQLAAARAADDPDPPRINAEAPGVSANVAHARRDVGAGGRMLVRRALAEVERHHDEARSREPTAVHGARRAIVAAPRAPVHVNERRQRPLRFTLGPVDAREELLAARSGEGGVLL